MQPEQHFSNVACQSDAANHLWCFNSEPLACFRLPGVQSPLVNVNKVQAPAARIINRTLAKICPRIYCKLDRGFCHINN